MKQLSIFQECIPSHILIKKKATIWKLFIDGASRNNPGKSGAGIYILKNDMPFYKSGFYLGHKTNNQAEYFALLLGVFYCKKHVEADDVLCVISDSELLVKHLKGEYKVKNSALKQLLKVALLLLQGINYSFCHVLREFNKQADALANEGIDKRVEVPEEFVRFLHVHDIIW